MLYVRHPQNIVWHRRSDPGVIWTRSTSRNIFSGSKRTGREVYDWFAADKEIEVDIFGIPWTITCRCPADDSKAPLSGLIYYYNQADYEQKIINLIRLYGNPDEFTKRYYAHKIDLHPIDPYMQKNRSTDS